MNVPPTPLEIAIFGGTVPEVGLLLQNGADPAVASADGLTPLHMAAARGRLEVCAMLLDAGADPTVRQTKGASARDVAAASAAYSSTSVVAFLDAVLGIRRDKQRLNPGRSFLEIARLVRKQQNVGSPCPACGVLVPDSARDDHVYSHAWEIQVKDGDVGGRGWAAPAPPSSLGPDSVATDEEWFRGSRGNPLCVSPTHLKIVNVFGSDIIPLESIQTIGLAGWIWKRLDIATTGGYFRWECGRDERKTEAIRQLILNTRRAFMDAQPAPPRDNELRRIAAEKRRREEEATALAWWYDQQQRK